MPINYFPKTGEVLICDFGPDYARTSSDEVDRDAALKANGRLPPEMVKKRLVVVLNGKMAEGCIVVPLSSTEPLNMAKELNVLVEAALIHNHRYFTAKDRWAAGDQMQQVSKLRLQTFHPNRNQRPIIPPELIGPIQRSVIKAMRASSLLAPATDAHQLTPRASPAAAATSLRAAAPASAMANAMAIALTRKEAHPTLAAPGCVPHIQESSVAQSEPDGSAKAA